VIQIMPAAAGRPIQDIAGAIACPSAPIQPNSSPTLTAIITGSMTLTSAKNSRRLRANRLAR